jgi:hypothetical protein
MKRLIFGLAFLIAAAATAWAQTTAVTATLTDPNGTAWIAGTCSAIWTGTGNPSTTSGQSFSKTPACTVNGSGVMSVTVTDVAYIQPPAASWQFCATPGVVAPSSQYCTIVAATGASESISAQIQSVLVAPSVTGGLLALAYADSEVTATAGNQYFNLTTTSFRCYTSSWGGCGGTGSFNALTVDALTGSTGGSTQVVGINHVLLSSLATGLYKFTAGVPSAAVAGTDYVIPSGNITGTAANLSGTPALPNGTTGTTQTVGDNTTKLATDAFVLANAGSGGTVTSSGSPVSGNISAFSTATNIVPATAAQIVAAIGSTAVANATAAVTSTTTTNLAGTTADSVPYQSASATTSYVNSPTVNGVYGYGWNVTGSAAVAPASFQLTGAGISCTGSPLVCTITGGTGSGTVNSGTAGQIAYYAATGTAVSGTNAGTNVLTALGNPTNAASGLVSVPTGCQAITSTSASSSTATVNWANGPCAVVTANSAATTVAVTFTNPVSGYPGGYFLGLVNNATPNTWTFSPTPLQLSVPQYISEAVYRFYGYDGLNYQGLGSNATPTLIYGTERSAPVASAAGKFVCWWDSTAHLMTCNDNAGAANNTTVPNGTTSTDLLNYNSSLLPQDSGLALASVVTLTGTQTLTNKSISGGQINSGTVAAGNGGTGVANTATLTLGTSNVNLASLGTGIVKNTTTTGNLTNAVAGTDYQIPISLTTTGSSGAATFNTSTGALNIPQYSGGSGGGGTTGWSGTPLTFAPSGGTQYAPPVGGGATSATESVADVGFPAAATLSKLYVSLSASLGTGTTLAVTLRDNGVSEALTCTTTSGGSSCSDTTDSFNVAQGDLVDFQIVATGTVTAGLPVIIINYAVGTSNVGVTSIATSAPITGGTITTTGTIGISSASNSALGAAKCDTNTTTCSSGTVSEVASTWYSAPWSGVTAVSVSTAGHIYGWGFMVPTPVTFGHIYGSSNTVDASNLYSLSIICGSSGGCPGSVAQGALICSPSAGSAIPAANAIWTNTCSQGSVTIYPGYVYIMIWTGNNTVGKLNGTLADAITGPYISNNIAGCTSTSGLVSGTCTISLSVTTYTAGAPIFTLN